MKEWANCLSRGSMVQTEGKSGAKAYDMWDLAWRPCGWGRQRSGESGRQVERWWADCVWSWGHCEDFGTEWGEPGKEWRWWERADFWMWADEELIRLPLSCIWGMRAKQESGISKRFGSSTLGGWNCPGWRWGRPWGASLGAKSGVKWWACEAELPIRCSVASGCFFFVLF